MPDKSVGRISRRDRSLESEALTIGSLRTPLESPSPRRNIAERVGPSIGSSSNMFASQRSTRSQEDLQPDDLRVTESPFKVNMENSTMLDESAQGK